MGRFEPNVDEGFGKRTQAFFRSYFATCHVVEYLLASRVYSAKRRVYSGYNDYSGADQARLKNSLLDIKSTATARDATVDVFLIP